jgi:hypothetical protein
MADIPSPDEPTQSLMDISRRPQTRYGRSGHTGYDRSNIRGLFAINQQEPKHAGKHSLLES